MKNQPGKSFGFEPAVTEIDHVSAFLKDLKALSLKHKILLSGQIQVDMRLNQEDFDEPCGYVLQPVTHSYADQEIRLNEDETSFVWRDEDELQEEPEEETEQ